MKIRIALIIASAIVFVMGLLMVFNTSSAEALDDFSAEGVTHYALLRQMLFAAVGVCVALAAWRVGYDRMLKLTVPLLVFFTILLSLTFVPGIGLMRNGSHRWLAFAGYTMQPSEFVKFLVPAYYIYSIRSCDPETLSFKTFFKIVAPLVVPLILIMIEPDNRTTGIICVTMLMLFFATRLRARYWILPALLAMMLGIIVMYNIPYVAGRMKSYLHPELDLSGWGHQPYQARIATGSGKLWGVGLGNSFQKLNYLPEAQNDYIAAIYAEEFGFIGIFAMITVYMFITYLGIIIAVNARDREGTYLALTITFLIAFQAFLNLGVVSGLLPSTGLNLPFFSQGGTSLVTNIGALGILLNIGYKAEKGVSI